MEPLELASWLQHKLKRPGIHFEKPDEWHWFKRHIKPLITMVTDFPTDTSGETAAKYVDNLMDGRHYDIVKAAKESHLSHVPFLETIVSACMKRARKLHLGLKDNVLGDSQMVSQRQQATLGCSTPSLVNDSGA